MGRGPSLAARALSALCCAAVTSIAAASEIPRYQHTFFSADDGAPKGATAFSQDRQGYLWIAADTVYRFDGLNFFKVPNVNHDLGYLVSLLSLKSGDTWLSFNDKEIDRFHDGKWVGNGGFNYGAALKMLEAPNGDVYAYYVNNTKLRLKVWHDHRWTNVEDKLPFSLGPSPFPYNNDFMFSRSGRLWAALSDHLVSLGAGLADPRILPFDIRRASKIAECDNGQLIIADDREVRSLSEGAPGAQPVSLYRYPKRSSAFQLSVDKLGQIWVSINQVGVVQFACPDAAHAPGARRDVHLYDGADVSRSNIESQFIDSGNNVWISTDRGIVKLRREEIETPLSELSSFHQSGLFSSDFAVFPGAKGSVYAVAGDKLYRILPGAAPRKIGTKILTDGAMCAAADGGLWSLSATKADYIGDRPRPSIRIPNIFPKSERIFRCAEDAFGNLIISSAFQIWQAHDGKWRQIHIPSPIGFWVMAVGPDGHVLGYSGRNLLYRIVDGRAFPVGGTNPKTVPFVRSIHRDGTSTILYDQQATTFLNGASVRRIPWDKIEPLSGDLFRQADGTTWTLSSKLYRIPAATFANVLSGHVPAGSYQAFDSRDGLAGGWSFDGYYPFAMGGDGRLWIATVGGISSVDTRRLQYNPTPPTVAITGIKTDKGPIALSSGPLRLPKAIAWVEINYTAVNLNDFSRSHFKYRIEGRDAEWIDPGKRLTAIYTNLPPGHYRFRVIASNESGVWNQQGTTLDFEIPPTFLQSTWFKLLCAIAALTAFSLAYLYRARRITERIRLRMAARADEREQIARDLHDTFLQAIQGLVLRFHSISLEMPETDRTRAELDAALDQADEVLIEGRERVRGLREAPAAALLDMIERTVRAPLGYSGIVIVPHVEGSPRDVKRAVAEELNQIAREFAANTLKHSQGRRLEIRIRYEPRHLQIYLSDDGIGITPEIIHRGREGHYGLAGMRERAEHIGATFNLISSNGRGTRAEISVPASIAYYRRRRWLGKS